MSRTIKIYDWEEWVSYCEELNEDPYETADLSLPARRQISGGDTENYEFIGEYPEREEE